MNYNERVIFYLGSLFDSNININDYNDNLTIQTLGTTLNYDIALKNLLIKTNNQDKSFKYYFGDNESCTDIATLVKNRCSDSNNSIILRCFNFDRHWVNYYNRPKDIPFNEKRNKLFWRGATTGQPNRKGNRFDLVTAWFNQPDNIDIAFSIICQNKTEYSKYIRAICQPEDFLKHKYIVSAEGNDKDSGLNWKLNSNSVVFMTRPRITSWLMETTLVPNFHYILLKDDFSDIQIKLDWCNNHPEECLQIIENAHNYMKQFNNKETEEKIEQDVINKYFELIRVKKMYTQNN